MLQLSAAATHLDCTQQPAAACSHPLSVRAPRCQSPSRAAAGQVMASSVWCRLARARAGQGAAALGAALGAVPAAARTGGGLARLERRRHQEGRHQGGGDSRGGRSLLAGLAVATLSTNALLQHDDTSIQDGAEPQEPQDDVLHDADRHMEWSRAEEADRILNLYRGSRHPEVLWRRGRVLYLMAEETKSTGGDRARHAHLVREGYAALQLALEQDPDCGRAYQWLSVLRYSLAELEGTLARLKSVDHIRADMERAIQLLPGDDVPRTMLGMWFYEMSQLTWLERQVVQAAGQAVPEPDYALRQAVHWFQEAERLHPAKSCLNQLMLGKALLARDDTERARACFERAATIPATSSSDAKAQLDARQLLECWKQ